MWIDFDEITDFYSKEVLFFDRLIRRGPYALYLPRVMACMGWAAISVYQVIKSAVYELKNVAQFLLNLLFLYKRRYQMSVAEDFNRLYTDVSESICEAVTILNSLNVESADGKSEVGSVTNKLNDIRSRFDHELLELKTHAEWDIFTMAFFGETNAGKSTIIESLRILFNENSRQELLGQCADDMEQIAQVLNAHIEHVREGIYALHKEYTDELTSISQSTNRLTRIAQQEAQDRNTIAQAEADTKILLAKQEAQARLDVQQQEAVHRQQLAEQESNARLAEERQEASERLKIEQANAISRFKVRVALVGIGGILIGATSVIALLQLAGA